VVGINQRISDEYETTTIARDARSREVGEAIQRTVAADPELALSIVGVGLDALSSMMINSPETFMSNRPWVDLIEAIFAYVGDDIRAELVDRLLAEGYSFRSADTPR